MATFPQLRLRRLRQSEALRALVRETRLDVRDFIYPLFVVEGKGIKEQVSSMPGVFRFSPDRLAAEIKEIVSLKIPAVILFGIPDEKDDTGSSAYQKNGVVQQAIKAIKITAPGLIVITDVCLCEYTSHGHCGIVVDGEVDNDRTLPLLAKMALSHVEAGADIVAPSDMMDGRVKTIREALDEKDFTNIPILSYAAKYASGFYGPFREAAESTPQFGDRRGYQMDAANVREALREVAQDIDEGADIIMVKPALSYLDVIRQVRQTYACPLAAYNVSGEYAMVKAAAQLGWIEEKRVVLEILTSIKRAGADIILTYHAKDAARWLREEKGLSLPLLKPLRLPNQFGWRQGLEYPKPEQKPKNSGLFETEVPIMSINYYVVGSTHEHDDRPDQDTYDYMVSQNVVSVAWAGTKDLSSFVGSTEEKITDYLNEIGRSDACPSLKLFLNLHPNDMIAIKKRDGHGGIKVYAYARIEGDSKGKIIYSHDKIESRHKINVEYTRIYDKPISFPYNYPKAMQRVTDLKYIKEIFGT